MRPYKINDDDEFVFISDSGQLTLGTARTCDNCGCLCAVNSQNVQRIGFQVPIYRHEVREIWANDAGDALCDRCI